jgi:hypothetical protein
MYLVACTLENGTMVYRLHGVNIADGTEPYPNVVIRGSYNGVAFDAIHQTQRVSLTLSGNEVVFGFGAVEAEDDDENGYSGWVMAYDKRSLAQSGSFASVTTGSTLGAGVWQSGRPPVVDSAGFVYVFTGNAYNGNGYNGDTNFSESALRLDPADGLALVDSFTPSNWTSMDANDADLSSAGPLLIPDTNPSLLAGGGKTGTFYVLNTSNLGKYTSTDSGVVQKYTIGASSLRGGPVYWQRSTANGGPLLYDWATSDAVKAFAFNGKTFATSPIHAGSGAQSYPGGILALSANGQQPGTGVLWATVATSGNVFNDVTDPGALYAFDADNVATQLYSSNTNASRDSVGSFGKFVPPMVANGKVYVATFSDKVAVYGLLNSSPGAGTSTLSGSQTTAKNTVNITTEGALDWVHWGDGALNRKSGVTAQLSTYSVVGSAGANTYGNDPRGISWSDGSPTATATADTKGVYIYGTGNGFSFTAPASTTTRVLTVHVGGDNSGGTLTASLGDGSAPNFVSTTGTASGQYDENYTLTYTAGSTTTLTVKWVMSSGTGNVTIEAAALSSISSQPAAATPTFSPAPGIYTGTQPVTLSDATSGAVIHYTTNGTTPTTASAQYVAGTPISVSASETIEAIAVASGYSTSSVASGTYTISAQPVNGTPTLTGSRTSATTTANITTEGALDWVHWGDSALNRKSGVTAQLSTYSVVGSGGVNTYGNDPRGISWSDGTPTATATADTKGVYTYGTGNGFSFTAPASTTTRVLTVHVGGDNSGGTLTASQGDGSAANYVNTTATTSGQYDANYTLTYAAGSTTKLTVKWIMSSGTGNVTIDAAALSN